MPVVLRKRKAHQEPSAAPAPAKKKAPKAAPNAAPKAAPKKAAAAKKSGSTTGDKSSASTDSSNKTLVTDDVAPGDEIDFDNFGGEVQTNEGETTTLKQLVADSKAGVVLFTYPKASTPGCTQQVCLFRDSYEPLTAGGLAIYGLSTDSPKANTNFRTKQNLPYPLLCDPTAVLIGAIGLKKHPKGTQRGVFAVDKKGKVLVAEAGGPAATVERIKKLVDEGK